MIRYRDKRAMIENVARVKREVTVLGSLLAKAKGHLHLYITSFSRLRCYTHRLGGPKRYKVYARRSLDFSMTAGITMMVGSGIIVPDNVIL